MKGLTLRKRVGMVAGIALATVGVPVVAFAATWDVTTQFSVTNNSQFALASYDIRTSVPEPSTWAMMVAGFALLGYAGFRRSKTSRLA